MTKATRETTKLNFITDQGSTRAMVRWACRAERLDDGLGRALGPDRARAAGPGPACALPGPTLTVGVRGLVEFLAFALERRKFRAGDDGEVGAGSGAFHTNAAAETDGSASAGWGGDGSPVLDPVSNMLVSIGHPVPVWATSGSAGSSAAERASPRTGSPRTGSAADGDAPFSAGAQSSTLGETGDDTGRLNANGSRA